MTAVPPPDDGTRTSAGDPPDSASGAVGAVGGVPEGTSWFADPEALLESLRGVPRAGLPAVQGYEVLHEIARGGQGTVYLARQRSTRRQVALKLLLERGFATASARRRFEREIELLASIDHPGIVKVFDSGVTADGRLYLVMELIGGVPLDQAIAPPNAPGPDAKGTSSDVAETHRRTLRLMADVADAVHAAHRRGVIHRDLKPSNILVDAEGHPRIVDFGLARALDPREGEVTVSVTGQFVGSLPWASPEHAAGAPEAVDVRSDVYSLGVVLYQALTGSLPYRIDGSFASAIKAITEAVPQRPSALMKGISRDLDAVVLTCLAKDPETRYGSAAELAADLRAVLQQEPIRARRDSTWDGMSRTIRRYRLIATVSTAALVAVAALGSLAWWQSRVAERERALAVRRFDEARELARAFLFEFHEAVLPLAGSRPARERIVATALDYLHGLEAEIGDEPQFRADLAAAYERVADIQGNPTFPNLGQSAQAIESFRAAVALRQANLALQPDDAETLRMTGRALGLIGLIQWQTGASEEALATLAEGDALLQRARALRPKDPLLLREIAANRDRASTLRDMHGDVDASLALLEEGIAALDGVEDRASVRDALDVLLYKKAFSLRKAGKLEESLAASLRSIGINRDLIAEEPASAARRRSLSVSLNELATTQIALRRLDDAGRTLEESIAIARELHQADEASPTTINDLAYALAKLASLERERGDYEASIRVYGEVHELRADASRRDPTNAVIRRGAAIAVGMAAESAEAAIADPSTPTDRHAAFARRAIDRYEECRRLLKAMQDDGVMLKGDEGLLDAFTQAIERLRPTAGDASGSGTP